MSTLWKVLLGLVLALPLAAFVTGALLAASADDPAPRETIVIQDGSSRSDDGRDRPAKGGDQTGPGQQHSTGPDDEDDDEDDDHGGDRGDDDDDVEEVRPEPDTVEEDNSGPGSSGGDDGGGDDGGGDDGDRDTDDRDTDDKGGDDD